MSDSPHLRGSDFEELLNTPEGGMNTEVAAFRVHLAQCASCRGRMEGYQKQTNRLRVLRAGAGARTDENCPGGEQVLKLAAGLLEEHESAAVMDHAAGCDACGTLLRIAAEDLQNIEIPAEAAAAMGEPFRTRMASELRGLNLKEAGPARIRGRQLVWAGAGIAAGIVLLALFGRRIGTFGISPEQLLARAYEANRIWPMRFPEASYTPLNSVEKSAIAGGALLAEADAAVSKGFDAHPRDPRWLQLRSEVDFLRRRYDVVIANLTPLAEGSYISTGIWVNLGIAHLARRLAGAEAAEAEKAVEYFSRTLDAEPRSPIALFNRAIALETLSAWNRAEQDWKSYLEVDSNSGWADEARERLRQVTLKRKPGSAN